MSTPKLEKRSGCIAGAMNIIGQKWTALILRDLSYGSQRFADLERSIPEINPRTLSRRLDELEVEDVICRCQDSMAYELTKKGRDLTPVLESMASWGDKYC
ncbi:MAG TPA: helix-turn-helix domain-containing protein [Candidatus Saccharimonadales bacterium]|nr:helix-turn-helix domain-containing protein [Candidatus Saccharimonadales bacterium]